MNKELNVRLTCWLAALHKWPAPEIRWFLFVLNARASVKQGLFFPMTKRFYVKLAGQNSKALQRFLCGKPIAKLFSSVLSPLIPKYTETLQPTFLDKCEQEWVLSTAHWAQLLSCWSLCSIFTWLKISYHSLPRTRSLTERQENPKEHFATACTWGYFLSSLHQVFVPFWFWKDKWNFSRS